MRVLYVEDEKLLADAVAYLLKKAGFLVDLANDGNIDPKNAEDPTSKFTSTIFANQLSIP